MYIRKWNFYGKVCEKSTFKSLIWTVAEQIFKVTYGANKIFTIIFNVLSKNTYRSYVLLSFKKYV